MTSIHEITVLRPNKSTLVGLLLGLTFVAGIFAGVMLFSGEPQGAEGVTPYLIAITCAFLLATMLFHVRNRVLVRIQQSESGFVLSIADRASPISIPLPVTCRRGLGSELIMVGKKLRHVPVL